MRKHLFLLGLSLFLFSCGKEETTEIRVFNNTGFDIQEISINTGNVTRTYTDLPRGAYSTYQPVDLAYRYAAGAAVIDGVTYTYRIHDYVGEKELGDGKFTYEITLYDPQDTSALVVLLKQ